MAKSKIDLAEIFQQVTRALAQKQQALDEADEYNHDHGANMVQTFQTITSALEKKKGSSHSAALVYAGKQLSKTATSGSGKLYAQHLTQASTQFKGKTMDASGVMQLLQTLIGVGQKEQPPAQSGGGDLLGSLLGGLIDGGSGSGGKGGLDLGDLLGVGMSLLKGGGKGGAFDLIQSLLGGSDLGNSAHRTQSTQVVIGAFLQALQSLGGKK